MKLDSEAVKILKAGGIGVIPTDTIYGIVCSALSKNSVNEVYRLRKRSSDKSVIVLIGSKVDVRMFGVNLELRTSSILNKFWPGPVSVILPCKSNKFSYLHRGKNAIAFRVPAVMALRQFLKKTGPLIAPSANFEGETPAKTIREAKKYFGDPARGRPRQQASATGTSGRPASNGVDFYIDGGKLKSKPSTIVSIKNGKVKIIRAGIAKIVP